MAKRRDLKKMIDYLSGELMTETLLRSLQPKTDQVKLRKMMIRICDMNDEYRRRIGNLAGSVDKQRVKQCYKKLREDFNAEVDRIYEELMFVE
jgi:hypothetical protein